MQKIKVFDCCRCGKTRPWGARAGEDIIDRTYGTITEHSDGHCDATTGKVTTAWYCTACRWARAESLASKGGGE